MMKVTLATIAKKAGFSTITVSRALNNKPDINTQTKEKILTIAKELGYTPNLLAKSLKAGKTRTIGVIVSDISNPFFSLVIKGIEDFLRKKGYSFILGNSDEDYKRETEAIRLMIQKRVDGILITPVEKETPDLTYLTKRSIPCVLVARFVRGTNLNYVVSNDMLGSLLATEHLIHLGHRRILYLAGPVYVTTTQERLDGYKNALEKNGIAINPELIQYTNAKMEDGYNLIRKAISKNLQFTAVSTFNDYLAAGTIKALQELNMKIPEDIAIIGYDDIEFASLFAVPLSTVRIPCYELGFRAAEILIHNIENSSESSKPQGVVLNPELIIRNSTLKK